MSHKFRIRIFLHTQFFHRHVQISRPIMGFKCRMNENIASASGLNDFSWRFFINFSIRNKQVAEGAADSRIIGIKDHMVLFVDDCEGGTAALLQPLVHLVNEVDINAYHHNSQQLAVLQIKDLTQMINCPIVLLLRLQIYTGRQVLGYVLLRQKLGEPCLITG